MSVLRVAALVACAVWMIEGCDRSISAPAAATGVRSQFSVLIDGKTFKGDRITAGGSNRASVTPEGSEIREMRFSLAATTSNEDAVSELSLGFNFPVKQASYDLAGTDIAACNNCGVVLSQHVAPFGEYTQRQMRVNITSLTADRVAGTFSGTMELDSGMADRVRKVAPPTMRIENGQFDIPLTRP